MQPAVVTLDEVIVGCEPFLRRALGEAITLKLSFEPGLAAQRIDAAQFWIDDAQPRGQRA